MNEKVILKERKVFEKDNRLYLKLVYEYEDDRGIHELIIPKMDLGIITGYLPIINHDFCAGPMDIRNYFINRYSDTFMLLPDDVDVIKNSGILTYENVAYVINTIKENPREMTLSEIEKKLGHKIKLVSEENKNE